MSGTSKKVGILTIGTEITSGQITNTNAAWLAEQCINLRLNVVLHASVSDDEKDIVDLLRWAEERCDILILSGGLGPTRDDLTRNAIASWINIPLQLDAASWQRIQDRLASFGLKTPESNRQQALFPKGTRILPNKHGTADAFYFSHTHLNKEVSGYCLPGVPSELHALWSEYLAPELATLTQTDDSLKLLRWHTLGKSEAETAELVESALEGSHLLTGFRAHFPYIETKVWCWEKDLASKQSYFHAIDQALAPWLVSKNDGDIAREFVELIPLHQKVILHDATSDGYLTQRLKKFLVQRATDATSASVTIKTAFGVLSATPPSADIWFFALHPIHEDGSWTLEWRFGKRQGKETLQSSYQRRGRERQSMYVAERSLWHWLKVLEGGT